MGTGFMSNRGRQNVASFLIFDLRVDWRWGSEYFEMAPSIHPFIHSLSTAIKWGSEYFEMAPSIHPSIHSLSTAIRWGAEYFEMALVDHDVCANWGNWHSIAGLAGNTHAHARTQNTHTHIHSTDKLYLERDI